MGLDHMLQQKSIKEKLPRWKVLREKESWLKASRKKESR